MKQLTFVILFFLVNALAFSQTARNQISDPMVINEIILRVNKLEDALKKTDSALLIPYLSPDFSFNKQPYTNFQDSLQLPKYWPKGRFIINNVHALPSGGYEYTAIIPGMLYLDIVMDNEYRFKSISEATEPDLFYDTAASFHANHLSLPFEIICGYYLMIQGSVNGQSGYFMFDTGTPMGFFLNNHFLNLSKTDKVTDSKMASGQQCELFYQDTLSSLKVASEVTWDHLRNILHADLEFIEKGIVSEFLGFIGYDAFKQYEINIDYQKKKIELYRLNDKGETIVSHIQDTPAVGTLKFQTSNEPQIPEILFIVNGKSLPTLLDTGSPTQLILTKSTQASLKKAGLLKMIKNPKDGNGSGSWQLNGLVHEGQKFNIPGALLEMGRSDKVVLGASFLSQFISSWNYRKKVITLYQVKDCGMTSDFTFQSCSDMSLEKGFLLNSL